MRVEARGYLRNSGTKVIFDEALTEAVVRDVVQEGGKNAPWQNTLYLIKSKSDGSITMKIGPRALSGFGGNYTVSVQITKDEIVKLFLESFPEVRDVIDRLPPPTPEPTIDL